MVFLRFRSATPEATKLRLMDELAGLRGHIDGLVDFQVRRNVSVEDPLVRGFRDVFWFDCRDLSVRDAYLADPTHREVGARLVAELEGGLEGVFVCDIAL